MKAVAIAAVVIACLFLGYSPSSANETFEIVADSTLDGNSGHIMRVTETGAPVGASFFLFEESGMIRAYAYRIDGFTPWMLMPGPQYLCPANSMTIGQTWRSLDDEGQETVAEVVSQEMVTTAAGTFSCYKVQAEHVNNPGTTIGELWFSLGVGVVKQTDYVPEVWESELQVYHIAGGSGFFPLATGNVWEFMDVFSPVQATTWGAVKSKYN